jgi:hypothetical protein
VAEGETVVRVRERGDKIAQVQVHTSQATLIARFKAYPKATLTAEGVTDGLPWAEFDVIVDLPDRRAGAA